jgi:hypothetical protein
VTSHHAEAPQALPRAEDHAESGTSSPELAPADIQRNPSEQRSFQRPRLSRGRWTPGRYKGYLEEPHPSQRSSPRPVLQDGTSDLWNDVPEVTAESRSVPIGCGRHGPDTSRSRGQRRSAWRTLAGKVDPRRLPRQASPARAIALLGGALAGSGPGTSPYIDGLSVASGMVIPQRCACSNHTEDGGLAGRHGHPGDPDRGRGQGLARPADRPARGDRHRSRPATTVATPPNRHHTTASHNRRRTRATYQPMSSVWRGSLPTHLTAHRATNGGNGEAAAEMCRLRSTSRRHQPVATALIATRRR